MGGIGDQINQYIFGCYVAKKKKLKLILDSSYYLEKPTFPIRLDKFEITNTQIKNNVLKINPRYISYLRFFNYKFILQFISNFKIEYFNYEYWKKNNEFKIKSYKDPSYFFGYWHNKKYYKKDIVNRLQLKRKSQKVINCVNMIKRNYVAVHIRGGDFLNDIHAVVLNEAYYIKAIKYFENKITNPIFYVFTNDISHAKKILKKNNNNKFIFVKKFKLKDFEEFELLRNFQNYIISNSTFGWTASLLSKKRKHICAPKNWYKNIKIDKKRVLKETVII